MLLLNLYQKRVSLANRIRGLLFQYLVLWKPLIGLRLSSNVQIWGKVIFGKRLFIGQNCKIYSLVSFGNDIYIGDNVELRCNGGNRIKIGNNVTLNRGAMVLGEVLIGNDCLIAPYCVIIGSNHIFDNTSIPINKQGISSSGVQIEENVWLGAHVTVLDGVKIGKNSIIGAGSVVTKDIPSNSIAVGNPCKVVRARSSTK